MYSEELITSREQLSYQLARRTLPHNMGLNLDGVRVKDAIFPCIGVAKSKLEKYDPLKFCCD